MLFALDLTRRVETPSQTLINGVAPPGISRTPIGANQEKATEQSLRDRMDAFVSLAMRLLGQTAAEVAGASIYGAVSGDVSGGRDYGPAGFLQAGGRTGKVRQLASEIQVGQRSRVR